MRKWFANLKVSQKLMLISIFFVMPDSLMLYLFITGINETIQFAKLEKKGNEYQRSLEKLLELIPEHDQLAQDSLTGKAEAGDPLSAKQAQVEAAFDELEGVDARIGADLQFTQEGLAKRKREHYNVHAVRQEWRDLKEQLTQLTPEARKAAHAHLSADVRIMITHAGDQSNLILDPDLDSYYLMDATLLALPATQDRLAKVTSEGEAIILRQAITYPERQQLAIHATLLKETDLDRIVASTQTAVNEDENFYGISPTLQSRVPPALKEYVEAAQAFIHLTTRLFSAEKMDVPAAEYLAAGAQARAASFKLWTIADEELDTLLEKRIEAYEHRRARSLLVTAFALLAAISFVTFITRSISGPLRQQATDLQTANRSLQAEIVERNRVEAQLRSSEAQLATAQQIASVGSWEWDIPRDKISWSDENYRIHGFEPSECEPSHQLALDIVHPEDRSLSQAEFHKALQEGRPFSFEQRIVRQDGTQRIVHQRGQVVQAANGHAIKIFGTAQDVTERKHAEWELERVHKQFLDTSRQAGMTEIATNVLHNVGNVLNSVNISTSLLIAAAKKSKVSNLDKIVLLLQEHEHDMGTFVTSDPQGKKLASYLAAVVSHVLAEQAMAFKELESLRGNIEHIKEIVAMQQTYAKVSGFKESIDIRELVEDSLRMNLGALNRHGVELIREFEDVPPMNVEKHKILQILVNLVRNAKYACDESERTDKQVTVRIVREESRVRISVIDNGVGIPPENLTRIFNHGFTTRKGGHGFGLHSGALAAKEIGGALSVHSDGWGRGATFTLELCG